MHANDSEKYIFCYFHSNLFHVVIYNEHVNSLLAVTFQYLILLVSVFLAFVISGITLIVYQTQVSKSIVDNLRK